MYPSPIKIASLKNLKKVWDQSKDATGSGGAAGIDNITPLDFKKNLEANLQNLRKRLIDKNYKFKPLKPYIIQKADGKNRVICVPCVQDRLVQRLILSHLAEEKDHLGVLSKNSYGLKKGKGVHTAIDEAISVRNQFPWVLKTDITQFFDKIPRKYLKDRLNKRVKARSLIPLLFDVIDCELSRTNKTQKKEIINSGIKRGLGLRQGMPLSPLLSNLVLRDFDRKIRKKGLRVIRYADDIICFCNSKDECLEAKNYIEAELKKVELSIPELQEGNSKTVILQPSEPVIFLGVQIYKQGKVYNKKIPKVTRDRAIEKIRGHSDFNTNLENGYTFADVVTRLEDIKSGYRSAFQNCTNLSSLEDLLKKEAQITKNKLLLDIFGADVLKTLTDNQKKFLGF